MEKYEKGDRVKFYETVKKDGVEKTGEILKVTPSENYKFVYTIKPYNMWGHDKIFRIHEEIIGKI